MVRVKMGSSILKERERERERRMKRGEEGEM